MINYDQGFSVNQLLTYQSSAFPVPITLVFTDRVALLMMQNIP